MANSHDSEILSYIFNPLLPTGELLYDEDIKGESQEDEFIVSDPRVKKSKELEVKGVECAEKGKLGEALDYFGQAVNAAPTSASAHNNRAQAYRLLGQVKEAEVDLDHAISLSGGKGRAGCMALCQRGLLHLKGERREEAKGDFERAAALGSQFAKAQLVQMNPYAALCNKMLKEVVAKLQRGESDVYSNSNNQIKQ